jgi:predicted SprT family Zn-dependent metalloprotease
MRRLLIALAALFVIVAGGRYAYGRESLRRADLGAWYQEDNAKYFGGELQPAHVRWGDLRAENAVGMTRTTGFSYLQIVLDRYELRTEADARRILRHEICHVATFDEEALHGAEFQKCMSRNGFNSEAERGKK